MILHEVSHGAAALAFGDDTAKRAGRLTLNPVKHIDPFGTIILPALLVLSGLGVIGYAKPVPVNVSRLRNSRNTSVVVSLVGPAVNIVLAIVLGFAYKTLVPVSIKALPTLRTGADLGPAAVRGGLRQRPPGGVQPDPAAAARRIGRPGALPAEELAARVLPDPALHHVHPAHPRRT